MSHKLTSDWNRCWTDRRELKALFRAVLAGLEGREDFWAVDECELRVESRDFSSQPPEAARSTSEFIDSDESPISLEDEEHEVPATDVIYRSCSKNADVSFDEPEIQHTLKLHCTSSDTKKCGLEPSEMVGETVLLCWLV